MATSLSGIYLKEPAILKHVDCGQSNSLNYGVAEMQGWRVGQEDAHNCILNFTTSSSFFAVYDGHGGPEISQLACQNLPDFVKNSRHWTKNDVEKSLVHSFLQFDQSLLSETDRCSLDPLEQTGRYPCCSSESNQDSQQQSYGQKSDVSKNHVILVAKKRSTVGSYFLERFKAAVTVFDQNEPLPGVISKKIGASPTRARQSISARASFDSGSTACVLIIKQDKLYVANIGDSRCVLCRNGLAVDLSVDHRPEDTTEKFRIETAGGYLDKENRVNGVLSVSRNFGDHSFKQNKLLPYDQQIITAYPDVRTEVLQKIDRFVILACDGIWNSLTSQELVNLVSQRLSKGLSLTQVCEEVCDLCLSSASNELDDTGCDNMTIIIVKFKHPDV